MNETIRKTFPYTLPVLAGYLFLGIAYGISMKEAGFSVAVVAACSVFIYAGSLQFALIGVLAAPFAPLTVIFVSLLLNARHLFYGLALLEPYKKLRGLSKLYCIFALTDETFSLTVQEPKEYLPAQDWYVTISWMDHLYWICGSVLGAVLGQVIPVDLTGIDFAMTALFTVIVTEQTEDSLKAWRRHEITAAQLVLPLLLGGGATLLSLLILGSGNFLLASMAVMMAGLYLWYRMERAGALPQKGDAHDAQKGGRS